jgi:nitrate reductase cytochrome c-type subunit
MEKIINNKSGYLLSQKQNMTRGAAALLLLSVFMFSFCSKKVRLADRFEDFKADSFVVAFPHLEPIEGKDEMEIGVTASDCAGCHSQIYEEWGQTTHATALKDIQFQSELSKENSPKWLCLNCHIPVQNQREYMITADTKVYHSKKTENYILPLVEEKNPHFDEEMQKEAITCATCHIRKDDKGKSVVIGAYQTEHAPHPVKVDKEGLRNVCIRCHSPEGEKLTITFPCWFETKDELANGPYAGKKDCVDCHMPVAKRKAVPADPNVPVRDGHQHHWVGGGIPKWYDGYDTLIDRGYESGLEVNVKSTDMAKSSQNAVSMKVNFKNAKAGHFLPTADPERFLMFRVSAVDSSGKEIAHTKHIIGQEWDWGDPVEGRPAKRIHDTRLKPKEERTWNAKLDLPAGHKASKVILNVIHVKVKSENAKYMTSATGINEKYLPNGQELVKNAIDHYPTASFVYRQDISFDGKQKKIYSMKELIELSKKEKGKPLDQRVY